MDHFNSSRSILLDPYDLSEFIFFIVIRSLVTLQILLVSKEFWIPLVEVLSLRVYIADQTCSFLLTENANFSTTCYLVCHVWDPNQKLIALKYFLIEKKMNMLWKSNVSLNIESSPWYIHFRNITKQTSNRISLMKGTLE